MNLDYAAEAFPSWILGPRLLEQLLVSFGSGFCCRVHEKSSSAREPREPIIRARNDYFVRLITKMPSRAKFHF